MDQKIFQNDFDVYVCPTCKNRLELDKEALNCQVCNVSYPIIGNIPDFIFENLTLSVSPTLRGVKSIDWLANIYESKWWYPLVLTIYGGWGCTTLERLVEFISGKMGDVSGRILDVACGPGTFGRRIASPHKTVYGIDISMGMLKRGLSLARNEQIPNVHFARAKAESLPFEDRYFNGAICCGALHLFPDTIAALREINRTLKEGSSLAVYTFTAGNAGILKFRSIREHVREDHAIHIFEIPELEQYLNKSGFGMFEPAIYGSVLTFSARKIAE